MSFYNDHCEPDTLTGNKSPYLLYSPFNPLPFYNTSRYPSSIASNGDGGSFIYKNRSPYPTRAVIVNYRKTLPPQFDQNPPNGVFTRY